MTSCMRDIAIPILVNVLEDSQTFDFSEFSTYTYIFLEQEEQWI